MTVELWYRKRININTDHQRRCYDGCNFSEKAAWSKWLFICEYQNGEIAQNSAKTFQSINPTYQYKIKEI